MHTTMVWLAALAWVSIAVRAACVIYINRELEKSIGGWASMLVADSAVKGWHFVGACACTIVAVTLP